MPRYLHSEQHSIFSENLISTPIEKSLHFMDFEYKNNT